MCQHTVPMDVFAMVCVWVVVAVIVALSLVIGLSRLDRRLYVRAIRTASIGHVPPREMPVPHIPQPTPERRTYRGGMYPLPVPPPPMRPRPKHSDIDSFGVLGGQQFVRCTACGAVHAHTGQPITCACGATC